MGFPAAARGVILRPMGKRPRTDSVPDLFTSAATSGEGSVPQLSPQPISRTVLPGDLPSALTHLSERDLTHLADALAAELRRRRLPATLPVPHSDQMSERAKPSRASSGLKTPVATDGAATLPQGKVNAIRAAVKAGVKPTMIARQFGVSLAAIRKALRE